MPLSLCFGGELWPLVSAITPVMNSGRLQLQKHATGDRDWKELKSGLRNTTLDSTDV